MNASRKLYYVLDYSWLTVILRAVSSNAVYILLIMGWFTFLGSDHIVLETLMKSANARARVWLNSILLIINFRSLSIAEKSHFYLYLHGMQTYYKYTHTCTPMKRQSMETCRSTDMSKYLRVYVNINKN